MLKNLLTLSVILFFTLNSSAQVLKFRTTEIAIKLLQENGEWAEWSEWEDSNSLVSFNTELERITIYGEPNRTFDIISSEEKVDEDGDTVFIMNCLGANENECVFKIVKLKNGNVQFYIYYSEAIIVYNVIVLE
ncbi:hypothetical protein [Mesoflavibacter zeaxanthinifaciens]|uniref:hypothetical protein n=1 Tax=Mesoflavibacter zeaxanthinifaciens TaxID=393060 RepID=UPI000485EA78|nr:hypothetical protein [Mesoflavibacter zeaxanthinifaciens]